MLHWSLDRHGFLHIPQSNFEFLSCMNFSMISVSFSQSRYRHPTQSQPSFFSQVTDCLLFTHKVL